MVGIVVWQILSKSIVNTFNARAKITPGPEVVGLVVVVVVVIVVAAVAVVVVVGAIWHGVVEAKR